MDTRRKGYVFFLCIGIIAASVLSLYVTWGQFTIPKITPDAVRSATNFPDEMAANYSSFLSDQTIPIKGMYASFNIFSFPIPYWIAIIFVASSSVMIAMNVYKIGDFPVLMVMPLYGVAAFIVVGAGTELAMHGKLSIAYSLACIGPIAGMGLAWYVDPQKT